MNHNAIFVYFDEDVGPLCLLCPKNLLEYQSTLGYMLLPPGSQNLMSDNYFAVFRGASMICQTFTIKSPHFKRGSVTYSIALLGETYDSNILGYEKLLTGLCRAMRQHILDNHFNYDHIQDVLRAFERGKPVAPGILQFEPDSTIVHRTGLLRFCLLSGMKVAIVTQLPICNILKHALAIANEARLESRHVHVLGLFGIMHGSEDLERFNSHGSISVVVDPTVVRYFDVVVIQQPRNLSDYRPLVRISKDVYCSQRLAQTIHTFLGQTEAKVRQASLVENNKLKQRAQSGVDLSVVEALLREAILSQNVQNSKRNSLRGTAI